MPVRSGYIDSVQFSHNWPIDTGQRIQSQTILIYFSRLFQSSTYFTHKSRLQREDLDRSLQQISTGSVVSQSVTYLKAASTQDLTSL